MSASLPIVHTVDPSLRQQALARLDCLTKPQGSLGVLEALAVQVCEIQGTLDIRLGTPVALVFAGDHGVAARGVSAYPAAVTAQMVSNFLSGGAAISVLARLQGMKLWVVDAGVDADCAAHPQLIDAKIRRGTRDFAVEPAMTADECATAMRRGAEIVERTLSGDSNVIVLGEMGIGNTASSALLTHLLTGLPLADCVGRGTGLDDAGLVRKRETLTAALQRQPVPTQPVAMLEQFGGYETAMLVGAALAAAHRRALILVDGFTVTAAIAIAARMEPTILSYCVFGHCSAEHAHRGLLGVLGVRPLLDLRMRLGEGSGAAIALPVVRSAVALFTQMATFAGAGVSEKHE